MNKMYEYEVYGLTLHSEIVILVLSKPTEASQLGGERITIKRAEGLTAGLPSASITGLFYQQSERALWVHIPGIAYCLVKSGLEIHLQPIDGADEAVLSDIILTLCLPVIFLQRHVLALRGSSIKVGQYCFSLLGESGSGKSTLTAAFLKRGYSILSDDCTAVTSDGQAIPGFPFIKLWHDALNRLEIEKSDLRKVRAETHQYWLPTNNHFNPTSLPICAVYNLCDANQNDYDFEPILGVQKINYLQHVIYRKQYIKGIPQKEIFTSKIVKLAKQVRLTNIIRPSEAFKPDECIAYIENDLTKMGYL